MMSTKSLIIFVGLSVLTFIAKGHFRDESVNNKLVDPCSALNYTICHCGSSEKAEKIIVNTEMCKVYDPFHKNSYCEPCRKSRKSRHICENFENCAKCVPEMKRCLTCPSGRRGKYCHKTKHNSKDSAAKFSHAHRYERDADAGKPSHVHRRDSDYCVLPKYNHAETTCVDNENSKDCHIRCHWGYAIPESGTVKDVRCPLNKRKANPWDFNSTAPEICKTFVNCEIEKTKTVAHFKCDPSSMYEPVKCHITCPEYKSQTHETTCTVDSLWHPPLPNCVKSKSMRMKDLIPIPNCMSSKRK